LHTAHYIVKSVFNLVCVVAFRTVGGCYTTHKTFHHKPTVNVPHHKLWKLGEDNVRTKY